MFGAGVGEEEMRNVDWDVRTGGGIKYIEKGVDCRMEWKLYDLSLGGCFKKTKWLQIMRESRGISGSLKQCMFHDTFPLPILFYPIHFHFPDPSFFSHHTTRITTHICFIHKKN